MARVNSCHTIHVVRRMAYRCTPPIIPAARLKFHLDIVHTELNTVEIVRDRYISLTIARNKKKRDNYIAFALSTFPIKRIFILTSERRIHSKLHESISIEIIVEALRCF